LEDRIVKDFGRNAQPKLMPVYKKPLIPGESEITDNNRSRSAKLRAFIKSDEDN
jgi:16S rRNA C1402 N4-methylase RsmH